MSRSGFTLIELSVVLVVIGLIVGGILVGTEMIKGAEGRALMSQMDGYEAAVTTFQLKYNCLPGDCGNASQLGLGSNGDGNGLVSTCDIGAATPVHWRYAVWGSGYTNVSGGIDPTITEVTPNSFCYFGARSEPNYFWVHLSNARLIPGRYRETVAGDNYATLTADLPLLGPLAATGKTRLVVLTLNGKLYLQTGLTAIQSTSYSIPRIGRGAMNGAQALSILTKLGSPQIQNTPVPLNVKAFAQPTYPNGDWVALITGPFYYGNTGYCMENISGVYTFRPSAACDLAWRIQ